MALIIDGSTCAICEGALDEPYTATSGCAFSPEHSLFQFCDAPLHLRCLASWSSREEFSSGYFEASLSAYRSGYGTLLHVAPLWFLASGPLVTVDAGDFVKGEPYFAEVRLAQWPFRLYSRWREWEHFTDVAFRDGLFGPALEAAEQVMREVRIIAPSFRALIHLRGRASQR